jgi:hypothetical protein
MEHAPKLIEDLGPGSLRSRLEGRAARRAHGRERMPLLDPSIRRFDELRVPYSSSVSPSARRRSDMIPRRLRSGSFLALATLLFGASLPAQTDEFLFVGWPAGAFCLFTPATGAIIPIAPGPTGFIGSSRMKFLPGNRMVLGKGGFRNPTQPNSFYLFDRDTGVALPFYLPMPLLQEWATEFALDQDGDLFLTMSSVQGIWWMDHLRPGNYVRLFPTANSELVQDIDTGDYVFVDAVAGMGAQLSRGRRSGQITPITTVDLGPGQRLWQDYATGEFVYWPNQPLNFPQIFHRITGSGVITTVATAPWIYYTLVETFSAPAPGREYLAPIFGSYTPIKEFHAVDRSTGQTTLLAPFPGWLQSISALVRDRSRHLSTQGTGIRNEWTLFIDFADDPNRDYACALGISGIRPGISLPDGRVIRLNVDPLTWLGLSGQAPGFSGLLGRLDDRGTAQGIISLGWLPAGVAGIPFWLVGLTLDRAAPSGIRSVSDPIVIQLR